MSAKFQPVEVKYEEEIYYYNGQNYPYITEHLGNGKSYELVKKINNYEFSV